MKPVVKFVITDVHMGLQHNGLSQLIKSFKKKNPILSRAIDVDNCLVLFLNKKRTKAKLFQDNGRVLGYLSLPPGQALNQKTLNLIPEAFGGSIEYSKTVKNALSKFMDIESRVLKAKTLERVALYA